MHNAYHPTLEPASMPADAAMAAVLPNAAHSPAPRSDVLALLALAVVSVAASYASLRLTRFSGGVATLWVANGLLVGLLLPRTRWLAWLSVGLLGQAAARVLVGDAPLVVAGLSLANLVEIVIVVGWLRRGGVEDLRQAASLGRLSRDGAGATIVACVVSATLATLVRPAIASWLTWTIWFMAHGLGIVIVATLITCIAQPSVHLRGRVGHRMDYAACLALMLAACALTFLQTHYPLLFLAYLPLVLLAYRHDLSGMVAGTLLLAASSGLAAAADTGPFALMHGTPVARTLLWQVYVACGCLLAYATSVAVTERIRLLRRVRRSELQLRALSDSLPAMVARFDRDQRYTYANERSRTALPAGLDPIGRTLREMRGDAVYQSLMPRVAAVLKGVPQNFEGRTWIGDRSYDYRTQFVPDVAENGEVTGFYSLTFDISQAKEAERALASLARTDGLTGLANRRHFEDELRQAVNRAARAGGAVSLLSLDLDRFKGINDSFGHAVGDEVLKEFGKRLRASVYDVDLVGRMGGDEFLVLVEHAASAATGATIALRVIDSVREPMQFGETTLKVSTSIGVAVHKPAQSAEALLALADEALYEAKARGRDTWAVREG